MEVGAFSPLVKNIRGWKPPWGPYDRCAVTRLDATLKRAFAAQLQVTHSHLPPALGPAHANQTKNGRSACQLETMKMGYFSEFGAFLWRTRRLHQNPSSLRKSPTSIPFSRTTLRIGQLVWFAWNEKKVTKKKVTNKRPKKKVSGLPPFAARCNVSTKKAPWTIGRKPNLKSCWPPRASHFSLCCQSSIQRRRMSGGGGNELPKFMPISFFRRASRFGGVSGHLALQ